MPEAHPDNAHYPYDTNRVRELLKTHRKTRGLRSCFPCRHRKVRCDGHVPCASCVKRGHRELCRLPTEERPRVSDPSGTGDLGGGLDLDQMFVLSYMNSSTNRGSWSNMFLNSALTDDTEPTQLRNPNPNYSSP